MENKKNILIYSIISFTLLFFLYAKYIHSSNGDEVSGRPLAYYDFYPVKVDLEGKVSLDRKKLNDAIKELSTNIKDLRASSELIRLIEENSSSFLIDPGNNRAAKDLKDTSYHPENDNEKLLFTLKEIVRGIGNTLDGAPIEILIHDTRNPLKSIIEIENSITGRKVNDPNTNFGIELIKKYAKNEIKNGNIISYPIKTIDGRTLKATTIPIYDGDDLIALICMNIDTSKFSNKNHNELQKAIDSIVSLSSRKDYTDIEEIIEPIAIEEKYLELDRIRYELEKPLLVIKSRKGLLACAYINVETCNKTDEACAIVSGVSNYNDMMKSKVIATSDKAKYLGVKIGDLGEVALGKMN